MTVAADLGRVTGLVLIVRNPSYGEGCSSADVAALPPDVDTWADHQRLVGREEAR